MKIQVTDKSHNGKVFVRNLSAQKKVESQLDEINRIIKDITNDLKKAVYL